MIRSGALAVLLVTLAAACGGDEDEAGEPLLSGSVDGDYDGEAFTAVNGFATVADVGPVIVVGDGNVRCGSEDSSVPPSGHGGILRVDAFEVGTYSSLVQVFDGTDDYEAFGTGGGTVEITEVSAASIAGSVAWQAVDEEDDRTFSLSGSFEVLLCE